MFTENFFTLLLNLKDGWVVNKVESNCSRHEVYIQVECLLNSLKPMRQENYASYMIMRHSGNGFIDQDESITFKWKANQVYTDKELEYSIYYFVSNSTIQKIGGENLTEKEVPITEIKNSTTYYWYVVAKFVGYRVANSPTWNFKTKAQ